MFKFLAFLAVVAIPTHARALELPGAFSASYEIEKYSTIVGVVEYKLEYKKNLALFTRTSKLTGFVALLRDDSTHEVSTLMVDNDALKLLSYSYTQKGSDKNRDNSFTINWNSKKDYCPVSGTVSGLVAEDKYKLNIKKTVWDTLSIQLPLMLDVPKNKLNISYDVISKGKLKKYDFSVNGKETLEFDDEEIDTIILERKTDKEALRFWVAPELKYLPVMIEKWKNNKLKARFLLSSYVWKD